MNHVEAIFVCPVRGAAMQLARSIHVVPGTGIEGDRYSRMAMKYGKRLGPQFELTLIEAEACEAYARDYGTQFSPSESRRNIVTRGVALNHLVGREFVIGDVKLLGIKLCEPCNRLAKLTGKDVLRGLRHRGGLRAQILAAGAISTGDEVRTEPGTAAQPTEDGYPKEAIA